MPVESLEIAEPFFSVRLIADEPDYRVRGKVILLNLSESPIRILRADAGPAAISCRG